LRGKNNFDKIKKGNLEGIIGFKWIFGGKKIF